MQVFLKIILFFIGIIMAVFFSAANAIAQEEQLDFEEVKVIAPYEPSISDAYKITDVPVIADTVEISRDISYDITPVKLETSYEVEPIQAASMRGEPISKLYKGHLKGGFGTHSTPYGELFYNSLRSNEYSYGLRLKHHSSKGNIEDYPHSGYSDNIAEIYGKRFFREHTLEGGVDLNRNMVHFYGINKDDFDSPDEFPEKEDIQQYYQNFSANTSFRNNTLDSLSLSYDFDLNYNFLKDDYDAEYNNINFEATLQRQLPPDPMEFAENQHVNIDVYGDYYKHQSPADNTTSSIFGIKPRLSSSFKEFDFYLGFDAAIESDTSSYFRIHPIAGSEINLIDDALTAYAYLTGGINRHNLYDFYSENPFINTALDDYRFKNKKSEIGGGFKGAISSLLSYNLSVSNSTVENYAFFVTDTIIDDNNEIALDNKMTVVYDDIRLFKFRAEFFSQVAKRINIRFAGNYYQYALDNEIEPWHKPTMRLDLSVNYNIQDKIILTAEAFARDSFYGRTFDEDGAPQKEEIHGFHVDTNFGIEYRYTKTLSAFLNFNNVQNQPLERWLNYPSQRFNFLGGITYSF